MDRYPEYRFMATSAQHFRWLEELYPKVFERLQAKIKSGQFGKPHLLVSAGGLTSAIPIKRSMEAAGSRWTAMFPPENRSVDNFCTAKGILNLDSGNVPMS